MLFYKRIRLLNINIRVHFLISEILSVYFIHKSQYRVAANASTPEYELFVAEFEIAK